MRSLSSSKRRCGLADGADDAIAEIVAAADVVEHGGRQLPVLALDAKRVEHHAVDGEVAAENVFRAVAEKRTASGGGRRVGAIGAEGGNLGDNFARAAWVARLVDVLADEDDAEVGADSEGLREQGEDGVGMRGGGNVEVLRLDPEKHVAYAAAGEVGFVARGAEADDDGFGCDLGGIFGHGFVWRYRAG